MKGGVYVIQNLITGMCYIGSSQDIKARWSAHRRRLNRGIHDNPHLQRSWFKHGELAFSFEVIVYCEQNKILEAEQIALDFGFGTVGQDGLYNVARNAERSQAGTKLSESHKAAIKAANLGRKHNAEFREKCRINAVNRVYTEERRKNVSKSKSKKFCGLISPEGIIYSPIDHLKNFCKDHDLNYSSMHKVLIGARNSCNGWKQYIYNKSN